MISGILLGILILLLFAYLKGVVKRFTSLKLLTSQPGMAFTGTWDFIFGNVKELIPRDGKSHHSVGYLLECFKQAREKHGKVKAMVFSGFNPIFPWSVTGIMVTDPQLFHEIATKKIESTIKGREYATAAPFIGKKSLS